MNKDRLIIENSYCLINGKRSSRSSKNRFLNASIIEYTRLNYKTKIIEQSAFLFKNKHLVIGNVDKAEVVVCAYYDTPRLNFSRFQKYYPFNGPKQARINIFNRFAYGLTAMLILIVILLSSHLLISSRLIRILITLLAIIIIIKITDGLKSIYNYERNSISLMAINEIAEKLDFSNRKNVAFILFDDGTDSNIGMVNFFKKEPKLKDKMIILLDGISGVGSIKIGYRDEKSIDKLKSIFDEAKFIKILDKNSKYTPFSLNNNVIIITTGRNIGGEIEIDNNNTHVNYKTLDKLENGIIDLISSF